jgi:hypothetical protein
MRRLATAAHDQAIRRCAEPQAHVGEAVSETARPTGAASAVKAPGIGVGGKDAVPGEQADSQHAILALRRELTRLRGLMAETRREAAVLRAAITKPESDTAPPSRTSEGPGRGPRKGTRG